MDQHPRTRVVKNPDQPRVIGVRVGEDHGLHIPGRKAECAQVAFEIALEAREPRVDGGETPSILHQVPVGERVDHPVDAGDDVGHGRDCVVLARVSEPSRSYASVVLGYASNGAMSVSRATPAPEQRPRRRYAPRMPPEQRREQLIDAALNVILKDGYRGVSIEAIAREAGVTRPVVYDHFPNLARLLHALVEREEHYSLGQLAEVVPDDPGDGDPVEFFSTGVRLFLEAVQNRPATWRLILLPLEGTPEIVRDHVEKNRERILKQIEHLVRHSMKEGQLPGDLDAELAARMVRDLGEEAGRMVLTDPEALHARPLRALRPERGPADPPPVAEPAA